MLDEKIVKKLTNGRYTLEQLKLRSRDIRDLKKKGFNVKRHRVNGNTYYYIKTKADNNTLIISPSSNAQTEIWSADISDTHAGCKHFNEYGLRTFLDKAAQEGFTHVHHSGDLCDGYGVYRGQLNELSAWKSEDQAKILADVLNDYPLDYIAIKGNHDVSFEMKGGLPVGKILERMVPELTYIDDICGDLVLEGVLKRLLHLAGHGYAKSYPGQVYVRNLLDADRGHEKIGNKRYQIQVIQMGHCHTDMLYETAGIYIMHPGNFQGPNEFLTRRGLVGPSGGRLTKMKVKKGQILEYESRFVKVKK